MVKVIDYVVGIPLAVYTFLNVDIAGNLINMLFSVTTAIFSTIAIAVTRYYIKKYRDSNDKEV